METTGLLGQIRIAEAALQGLEHAGRRNRCGRRGEVDGADLVRGAVPDEILLEVGAPASRELDEGRTGIFGHREDPGRHAEAAADLVAHRGEPDSFAEPDGAVQTGRQVPVPEPEPGLVAVGGQGIHHREAVALEAVTLLAVDPTRQCVGDDVEIR